MQGQKWPCFFRGSFPGKSVTKLITLFLREPSPGRYQCIKCNGLFNCDIFDPSVDGTYDFILSAFHDVDGLLSSTQIQVVVGQGGAQVSEPATMLLFGLGLHGFAGVGRKKA
ncbi:MAG: PEP-CTERM sorting domain-containing protein [Desulfobacteraceae bacterium]|nr:PEP-CTERM sorting domain-containing protein [Desulfobacteraceae bacterium]